MIFDGRWSRTCQCRCRGPISPILSFAFVHEADVGTRSAFTSVRGRRECARARRNDDATSTTRGTRGTRVRRKQLNLLLLSLSLSLVGECQPSAVCVAFASSFPSLSLSLLRVLVPRGLPAKLNKHSYLHSISGALTSLDNPATDSSSSHVRASSIL